MSCGVSPPNRAELAVIGIDYIICRYFRKMLNTFSFQNLCGISWAFAFSWTKSCNVNCCAVELKKNHFAVMHLLWFQNVISYWLLYEKFTLVQFVFSGNILLGFFFSCVSSERCVLK